MYKEPSWFKPFKRNRLNLGSLTDSDLKKLLQETIGITQENERIYDDLNVKAKQMYSLAAEIYGNNSLVLKYLRGHRVVKPADYRKELNKLESRVIAARKVKASRERQRERRKQLASERAERERIESDQVGPQGLGF
jgi:uncharacterized protein YoxC